MPNTNSTYYTNQIGSNGDTRSKTYPRAQNPRLVRVPIDLAGTESANDTHTILRMKVGQYIIPGESYVTTEDAGTTLTANIGDSTDVDRYAVGINLATEGKVEFCSTTTLPAGELTPFAITEATQDVQLEIATTGTPAAAQVTVYLAIMDELAE